MTDRYAIQAPPLTDDDVDTCRIRSYVSNPLALLTLRVCHDSPRSVRLAVQQLALYFKREMRFDFPQYAADRHAVDDVAYVWSPFDSEDRAVGACHFLRMDDGKDMLAWFWLHPYVRRRGVLTAMWPYLREWHGDFHLDEPFSKAFEAFLARSAEPSLEGPSAGEEAVE